MHPAGVETAGGEKWGSRFSLIGWTDARKRRERKGVRERERKTTHGKSAPSSNKQIHHQLWQTACRITMSLSARSACEIQTRADHNKTRDTPYMYVLRGCLLCLTTEFWRPKWRHFGRKIVSLRIIPLCCGKKNARTRLQITQIICDGEWWRSGVAQAEGRTWICEMEERWGGAAGRYVLDWQAIITAHFKSLSQGVWALALREGPWLVMKPPPPSSLSPNMHKIWQDVHSYTHTARGTCTCIDGPTDMRSF